jgi:nucleotide-binding universal stress UspA family protein
MVSHILVPIDGSPQSEDALAFAFEEHPDADVTVLNVIDPIDGSYSVRRGLPISSEEWYEDAKAEAEELFETARETAAAHDADLSTAVEVGRPARVIVEYADEGDVDHVVMGSHGRSGVSRVLLGSVAETVARRSTVPVTVVR